MIKVMVAGLLASAAAIGASHAVSDWKAKQLEKPQVAARVVEQKKTRTLSVPIFEKGKVAGYIIIQFAYDIFADMVASHGAQIEAHLVDMTLRVFFSNKDFSHRQIEKYDLNALVALLKKNLNEVFEKDVVQKILVNEFNFVAKEDIKT